MKQTKYTQYNVRLIQTDKNLNKATATTPFDGLGVEFTSIEYALDPKNTATRP